VHAQQRQRLAVNDVIWGGRSASASDDQGSAISTLSPKRSTEQADKALSPKQSHQAQTQTRLETANAVPEKLENSKKYSVPGSFTSRPERHVNSSKKQKHVKYILVFCFDDWKSRFFC